MHSGEVLVWHALHWIIEQQSADSVTPSVPYAASYVAQEASAPTYGTPLLALTPTLKHAHLRIHEAGMHYTNACL